MVDVNNEVHKRSDLGKHHKYPKHKSKNLKKVDKKKVSKKVKKEVKKKVKKNIKKNIKKSNYAPKIVIIQKDKGNITGYNKSLIDKGYSPLSGYEKKFDPKKWNNKESIRSNHNCYSYAFNHIRGNRKGKAQPGYYANYPPITEKEYNCSAIYKRIMRDNPSIYKVKFEDKCGKGYYKIFFALSLGANTDYHFYRQDSNGLWSHKPGRTDATNFDASKKVILNPYLANRDYSHLNYSTACDFFCANPKMVRTHSVTKYN
tara:strand:- start:254 stop:1030 length:777 start_codon:yes stop_codon:yes gene_type:complete